MSCEGRAWLTNQPGVSLCTHVFAKGFGRPPQRARVKEARPLYFCLQEERGKNMSAIYRIAEKKCATCRWWNGSRSVDFRANQPYYVKVGDSSSTCAAKSNTVASAASYCSKWTRWEKI